VSRILLVAITVCAACIPRAMPLAPVGPAPQAETGRLASVPRFIMMPALDRRPTIERTGHAAELGLMVSTAALVAGEKSFEFRRASGAAVHTTENVGWTAVTIRGRRGSVTFNLNLMPSLASSVASDVGHALASAVNRPTELMLASPAEAAATAEDGSVIVTIIVDHFTQIEPMNADFVHLSTEQRTRRGARVTTTTTVDSTEGLGVFWTVALQIELAEVRNHQVARRLVRYAAATDKSSTSYNAAVATATQQVVDAVATEWAPPSEPPAVSPASAPGAQPAGIAGATPSRGAALGASVILATRPRR